VIARSALPTLFADLDRAIGLEQTGGRWSTVPRSLFAVRCSLFLFGVWRASDCSAIGGRFESVGRISEGFLRRDEWVVRKVLR
jgi:hypothetical protein